MELMGNMLTVGEMTLHKVGSVRAPYKQILLPLGNEQGAILCSFRRSLVGLY